LRDISKLFQGVMMARPKHVKTFEDFAKLWMHECQRQFGDRLTNKEDIEIFQALLQLTINNSLNISWTYEELFEAEKVILSPILSLVSDSNITKTYEFIRDFNDIKKFL